MRFDAHNHLQDPRLDPVRESWCAACGPSWRAVVNGTHPADWPSVARLAAPASGVVPSFGLHPWRVPDAPPTWLEHLAGWLDRFPGAAVGEIGLDHWVRGADKAAQRTVFARQWELAVGKRRPITVHCLQAWGTLRDMLRDLPPAPCGFLLHSFSGPADAIPEFLAMGARFSISPYFLHDRKRAAREAFAGIPLDRILVETDAPDMAPPREHNPNLMDPEGRINHPANLDASIGILAELFHQSQRTIEEKTFENANKLFIENNLHRGTCN